jgi:hypothetical protein
MAVAARTAVASAICVGVTTARARLTDERLGRFSFAEAGDHSDEDGSPLVLSRYPLSSGRRTAERTRERPPDPNFRLVARFHALAPTSLERVTDPVRPPRPPFPRRVSSTRTRRAPARRSARC